MLRRNIVYWALASALTCSVAQAGDPATASTIPEIRLASNGSSVTGGGGAIRYDADYPAINYGKVATRNAIARLESRLKKGEIRLEFKRPRGYLDSVLSALGIDPSSQTLVYSKTSLQYSLISAAKPRAIYFNDETYVAWIPGTTFLEIATMDAELGPVFYALSNQFPEQVSITRESSRCLTCHDTWGMAGGGVPRFLFLSTLVDVNGEGLENKAGIDTTDQTPIEDRWAGWYVTGQHGKQQHLGNILAEAGEDVSSLDALRRGNVDTLKDLFDTGPYLTDKSDIVALLVFEHQAHVGGFITRANFKSRTLLANKGLDPSRTAWASLPQDTQKSLKAMLEPLVRAMLFTNAAAVTDKVSSTSGFDRWFEAQGPRDAKGRSLRELDLRKRVFKYPVSYLVYSEGFDGLPKCDKEYIFSRFAEILSGRDQSATFAHVSASERQELFEILTSTKPEFARVVAEAR
jgi:hypothetical protein